jgi:hypothetical protein
LASWLTGVNIANNLLDVLIKDCDLDPADWRASMLDRAAMWWITWFTSNNTIFVKFSHALRLVVLAQASSAATERVFSQLQYICNVCGDKLLEDVLNLRTLIRCNGGLLDDFDS